MSQVERLRRKSERWSDLLIGHLVPELPTRRVCIRKQPISRIRAVTDEGDHRSNRRTCLGVRSCRRPTGIPRRLILSMRLLTCGTEESFALCSGVSLLTALTVPAPSSPSGESVLKGQQQTPTKSQMLCYRAWWRKIGLQSDRKLKFSELRQRPSRCSRPIDDENAAHQLKLLTHHCT